MRSSKLVPKGNNARVIETPTFKVRTISDGDPSALRHSVDLPSSSSPPSPRMITRVSRRPCCIVVRMKRLAWVFFLSSKNLQQYKMQLKRNVRIFQEVISVKFAVESEVLVSGSRISMQDGNLGSFLMQPAKTFTSELLFQDHGLPERDGRSS
ncbi:hypothetical protein ACP275_12G057300 [Erythranthe tilingii]